MYYDIKGLEVYSNVRSLSGQNTVTIDFVLQRHVLFEIKMFPDKSLNKKKLKIAIYFPLTWHNEMF